MLVFFAFLFFLGDNNSCIDTAFLSHTPSFLFLSTRHLSSLTWAECALPTSLNCWLSPLLLWTYFAFLPSTNTPGLFCSIPLSGTLLFFLLLVFFLVCSLHHPFSSARVLSNCSIHQVPRKEGFQNFPCLAILLLHGFKQKF